METGTKKNGSKESLCPEPQWRPYFTLTIFAMCAVFLFFIFLLLLNSGLGERAGVGETEGQSVEITHPFQFSGGHHAVYIGYIGRDRRCTQFRPKQIISGKIL